MKLPSIKNPKVIALCFLFAVSAVSIKLYSDFYNHQQQILEQKKKEELLRWAENERILKELKWKEEEKQREIAEQKKEQEMVLKRKQFVPYIQNEIIKAQIFGKKVFVKQKSDRILLIKVEGILGDNEGWLRWHKPNKPYDFYYLDAEKLGFVKVIVLEECTNWKFNNYTYYSEANWHYDTEWRNN